jgi:hypothetical protein
MELISDMGRVESRFSPFGDSDSVSARQVHSLQRTYHRHRKSFWTHSMGLLGDKAKSKLGSVRLEIVLLLMQYWCTVCFERTIGSEIVLEAPDGTPS